MLPAMDIQPKLALVRPRAVFSETEDSFPIEDDIFSFVKEGIPGVIAVTGRSEMCKDDRP